MTNQKNVNGLSQESGGIPTSRVHRAIAGLPAFISRWTHLTLKSIQLAIAPESQLVASSIGYFTLFSVFPLALLVVAIASNWIDPILAEQRIVAELEFVVPGLESMLGANIHNLVKARGPITGIAILALVWSASGAFNVVTRAMDRIWGADINHRRSMWRHRTLAVAAVLIAAGLLLVASSVEGTLLTIINSLLTPGLEHIGPFTSHFWTALLNILLFAILYYFMPHVSLRWRDVLPGAIVGGILWQIAKQFFLLFISSYFSRSNLVYGSVGTIIGFLFWTYLSSLILLLGAYLNRLAAVERAARLDSPAN